MRIQQDASLFVTRLEKGDSLAREVAPARRAYVHVIRGEARVNGTTLGAGDALKVVDEREVRIDEARAADILLFDLP